MNTQVSIYENAKHWIAQYESVDEVKEYIDKAAAVQEYAKRANDYEMEHQAARARVRAERRAGELLQNIEKAKGGSQYHECTDSTAESVQTLKDMGLNGKQSMKWQQLANVPEADFETALSEPAAMPSAHGILNARKPQEPPKRINEKCLYLWGRLVAIEKNLFNEDLQTLLDDMTPAMRRDSDRIIPLLTEWITNESK